MAKPRLPVSFRVPLTRDFSRLSHIESLLACLKGLKTGFADNKGQSGPLSFVSKIQGKCHYNCQLTSSRSSYENLIYKNLTSFYHSCSCSRKTGDLVFSSFYLSKFSVKTKYYCEGSEPRSHLISRLSMIVNNDSPIQDYVHPDDHTQPTYIMDYCCLLTSSVLDGVVRVETFGGKRVCWLMPCDFKNASFWEKLAALSLETVQLTRPKFVTRVLSFPSRKRGCETPCMFSSI